MTQSHMQALMKANLAMMIHFGEDFDVKLKQKVGKVYKLYFGIVSLLKHLFC